MKSPHTGCLSKPEAAQGYLFPHLNLTTRDAAFHNEPRNRRAGWRMMRVCGSSQRVVASSSSSSTTPTSSSSGLASGLFTQPLKRVFLHSLHAMRLMGIDIWGMFNIQPAVCSWIDWPPYILSFCPSVRPSVHAYLFLFKLKLNQFGLLLLFSRPECHSWTYPLSHFARPHTSL